MNVCGKCVNFNFIRYAKRATLSVILLLCLLIPSSVVPLSVLGQTVESGKTDEVMTAVYAFCDYEISLTNATYCADGTDDGKMLTDLVYTPAKKLGKDEKGEGWVRIKSKNGSNYKATVTLDFGFLAKDVFRFYLRSFRGSDFDAEMPDKISFYASSDGNTFEYVGIGTTVTNLKSDNTSAVFGVTLKNGIDARYIRAVIECKGGCELWLNEVGAAAMGKTYRANSDGVGFIRDYQGLYYRINNGVAEVYDMETEQIGEYNSLKPSEYSFDADGKTYYLGVGSDNQVKVISDFIKEGAPNYSGVPNNIKYIVIHNTATVEESTDAERYNYRMHNMNGESGWHYTVDENEIYHSLADSIVGFHSGASHNYQSIGIEICVNGAPYVSENKFLFSGSAYNTWVETRFKKSLRNAAVLVAELLTRYGLSTNAVIQHYDVTEKDCPLWMRANNGALWNEFLRYVDEYYKLINGTSPTPVTVPQSNIVIPDYIILNNGDVYPVSDIGASAFVGKGELLKSIVIGKSVDTIVNGCFDGNPLLETVSVSSGNDDFTVDSDNIVYDRNGNEVFNPENMKEFSPPNPKDGCTLDIREIDRVYYIFDSVVGHTVSYYVDEYGANEFTAVGFTGEQLTKTSTAGTGTSFILDGSKFYLVLRGDVDGDACIDSTDYVLIKRAYLKNFSPRKRQFYAMTVSGGNDIGVIDYIMIKRHVLGTFDLTK